MSNPKLSTVNDLAAQQLRQRLGRDDAEQITRSLYYGLSVLRQSMFARIHDDVEQFCGQDSMLIAGGPSYSEDRAKLELDLYQIVVAAVEAWDCGYVNREDNWYIPWLAELRIGDLASDPGVQKRLAHYTAQDRSARRLTFSDMLVRAFPEASRAPLVLFRLYPLSVQIVTALAFGEPLHANEVRNRQVGILPAIENCKQCHGAIVENGEECQACGNPLWKYELLVDPY